MLRCGWSLLFLMHLWCMHLILLLLALKLAFGTEQNVGLVDIALRSDSCAFAVLAVANAVGEDMWVPWAVVAPVVLEGQTARHLCWHTS